MATRIFPDSRAFVLILSGAFTFACGGGDLLLPDPPGGGDNVVLSKEAGDNQEGVVGEQLLQPLVVKVLTPRELPATGKQVEFVFTSAAGVVTPATAFTNSAGQATANWVLGTAPGPQTVAARLVVGDAEPQTEEFTAQAKAAAPDTLSAMSPTSQPGRRGRKAGTPPLIRVVDRFGNPVSDVPVAWQVISGQGSVSEPITRTQTDGTSTVEWTLGNRPGLQRLTADVGSITGSPVSFTATVLF